MTRSRKIIIATVAVIIILQFFKPAKNESAQLISDNDISKAYPMTDNVHQLLIKKCYDCHSNSTLYPWYYNIQPIGMWMAHHVNEGKDELNFSEFKTYSQRRGNHKIESISKAVNEGWMPLDSYLWIHKEAKPTPEDTEAVNAWIKSLGIVFEKEGEHHHHEGD